MSFYYFQPNNNALPLCAKNAGNAVKANQNPRKSAGKHNSPIIRTSQGMVLTSHQITKELIERATTSTGLTVVACILNKVYETKRKVVAGFKESMRILFDDILGQWTMSPPLKMGTWKLRKLHGCEKSKLLKLFHARSLLID